MSKIVFFKIQDAEEWPKVHKYWCPLWAQRFVLPVLVWLGFIVINLNNRKRK